MPFARHYFGDNYRYQDDNTTPHHARVVLDFLQQGNVTRMEQPPRSPDCNPTEHLWDELARAISSIDNTPQNLDELRQALLDKRAQIPVQRLQRLVASMPRRLVAIIATRGGNTRYWPGTHKTRPPGSVTKKTSLFDQICHNYFPVTFRYAHSANYSFYHQMSSKLTKHNRIKNRASNTLKTLYYTTCP